MTKNEIVEFLDHALETLEDVYPDLMPADKKLIDRAMELIEAASFMYEEDSQ